jgi:hypothetical protein
MNDAVPLVPTPAPATRTHELNELSFELPVALNDKTVHVFALTDDGPNEFNLVISRAKVGIDDTLEEFADRLTAELKRALPKFQLKRRQEARIDNSPAIELFYSWSNQGVQMQQRQTVTLVQSAIAEEPEALMVAATCAEVFNDHWHATYDGMLATMKLRRPWPPTTLPTHSSDGNADVGALPRFGFALSRDGTLHVTAVVGELSALAGSEPSVVRLWKFYRHDGQALDVLWNSLDHGAAHVPPDRGVPHAYRLSVSEKLGPLRHRLATIERVVGELQDLEAVDAHLKQWERNPAPDARDADGIDGPGTSLHA